MKAAKHPKLTKPKLKVYATANGRRYVDVDELFEQASVKDVISHLAKLPPNLNPDKNLGLIYLSNALTHY